MLPQDSDVDDFLDSVSEVERLISGLKSGSIPPEYVDSKTAARTAAKSAPPALQQRQAATATTPAAAGEDDADAASKQAELLRKVEELKESRQRKLKARQAYEAYIHDKQQQQQQHTNYTTSKFATDYNQWDLWCPSDDEDELFSSLTPNSPAFRAMEKDISTRHARMVEQRQIAERQRQLGNAAFKAGQHSEALRCYEQGLEAQRHNMTLHANAAMAALKLKCYVATQEHCDKVLHIAEVLHNTPKHPLCVKALQRRAAAYQGLGQHSKAVADLQAAADILPGDAEVLDQLQRAQVLLEEHRLAKRLTRLAEPAPLPQQQPSDVTESANSSSACTSTTPSCSSSTQGTAAVSSTPLLGSQSSNSKGVEVARLQRIKQLVNDLQKATSSTAGSDSITQGEAAAACQQLLGLLSHAPRARYSLFFRQCGGLEAAARLVTKSANNLSAAEVQLGLQASALQLLNAACEDTTTTSSSTTTTTTSSSSSSSPNTALESLSDSVLGAALGLIGSQHAGVAAAALDLAYAASISSTVRVRLCAQLLKQAPKQPSQQQQGAQEEGRQQEEVLGGQGAPDKLGVLWQLCCAAPAASGTTQVLATSLLSNCLLVPAVRAASHALLQQQQHQQQPAHVVSRSLLDSLAEVLAGGGGSAAAAAAAVKACGLLSNMCNHAGLRTLLAGCHPLMQQLLRLCSAQIQRPLQPPPAPAAVGSHHQQRAADAAFATTELVVAALGCLCNLSLDEGVQKMLAADAMLLDRLLQFAAAGEMGSSELGADSSRVVASSKAGVAPAGSAGPRLPARNSESSRSSEAQQPAPAADTGAGVPQLAARAATLLSRAAKQQEGAVLLLRRGAFGALAAAVSRLLDGTDSAGIAAAQNQTEWLGAAVRTMAVLAAAPAFVASLGEADSSVAGDGGGVAIAVCCRLLRGEGGGGEAGCGDNNTLRGNAALVIKAFAQACDVCCSDSTRWHAQLVEADAVGALLAAARSGGKGSASTRNAGIALALLAKSGGGSGGVFLERLRELRGLEVLYEYVRP